MSSNNRKVSIKLLRSAVFVVLAYWVWKVSIKLPRSGSFLNMEKVSIKLLRSAVLSTQKSVHRTANVRSSMDTFKNCHIWQDFPSVQCYQSIETNIGDHFYARTKLKLANWALWVARESSEEDPMTFIFDETLNLCEPEKFGESFASCRPATEGKKAGSINLYSISNYLLQMCFVDLWIIPLWIKSWFINPRNTLGVNS